MTAAIALVRADTLGTLVLDGAIAIASTRIDGNVTRYTAADRSALSDGRISLPGSATIDALVSPVAVLPTATPSGPTRIAQVRAWLADVATRAVEVAIQIPGDAPFAGLLIERVDEQKTDTDAVDFRITLVEVTIASTRGVTLTSLPRPPAIPRPDTAAGQATTTDVGTRPTSLLATGTDTVQALAERLGISLP